MLNLSGGADLTLLLAKIRERDRHRKISTTTYFHEDWRDDLNDWEYAREASTKLGSDHRLIKINNELFSQVHKELVVRATKCLSHLCGCILRAERERCDAGQGTFRLSTDRGRMIHHRNRKNWHRRSFVASSAEARGVDGSSG